MKIGIEISTITPNKAGVGYFTYEITRALAKVGDEHSFVLYSNNLTSAEEFSEISNIEIRLIEHKKPDFGWIRKVSKDANSNVDLFLSPANLSFSIFAKNTTQLVHDLAPIKYPKFFSKKAVISYWLQLELAIRRAKNVATPLESIRQEMIESFPHKMGKIHSIGAGTNDWTIKPITPDGIEQIKRKYSLPEKFILSTGTLEPRKNHVNMIKSFKSFLRMNSEYYYVIVGKKGWFYEEIFKIVEKLKLQDKVIFLGYVEESDLLGISKNASAFMFCSFYEGFGLPLVEAASVGLPIICSDISSFKEILKDSAIYVDPNDTIDIASGLRKVIEQKDINYSEVLKKYTWDNTAKNLLNVMTTN
jgi:glycosyltransferase involved in cell wall biosynthesis